MGRFSFAALEKQHGVLFLGVAALSVAFFGACGSGDEAGLSTGGDGIHGTGGSPGSTADGSSASSSGGASTGNRVCTPGTTLQCVGPGACRGGQVCNQTGTAFGVCDCGQAGAGGAPDASDDAPTSNRP